MLEVTKKTKIIKQRSSLLVIIPKLFAGEIGLRKGTTVQIKYQKNETTPPFVVIEKVRK